MSDLRTHQSLAQKNKNKKRKEGNVLFNDALNTFYLRLYGVRHMVKEHSDSERGNPLPPHRLLFQINSKVFYVHHPTTDVTKAVVCVIHVCGMVHIKEPLLLIDKSSLCGGSGFPFSLSEWSLTICLTPYNRR